MNIKRSAAVTTVLATAITVATGCAAPDAEEEPTGKVESATEIECGPEDAEEDAWTSTAYAYAKYFATHDGGIQCNLSIDGRPYTNLGAIPERQFHALFETVQTMNPQLAHDTSGYLWGTWGEPVWGPASNACGAERLQPSITQAKQNICEAMQALTGVPDDANPADVAGPFLMAHDRLQQKSLALRAQTHPDIDVCQNNVNTNACFAYLRNCNNGNWAWASSVYYTLTGNLGDQFARCSRLANQQWPNEQCGGDPNQVAAAINNAPGVAYQYFFNTVGSLAAPLTGVFQCVGGRVSSTTGGRLTEVEAAAMTEVCLNAAMTNAIFVVGVMIPGAAGVAGARLAPVFGLSAQTGRAMAAQTAVRVLGGVAGGMSLIHWQQCTDVANQALTAAARNEQRADCNARLAGNIISLGGTLVAFDPQINAAARWVARPAWQAALGTVNRTSYLARQTGLRWLRRMATPEEPTTPRVTTEAPTPAETPASCNVVPEELGVDPTNGAGPRSLESGAGECQSGPAGTCRPNNAPARWGQRFEEQGCADWVFRGITGELPSEPLVVQTLTPVRTLFPAEVQLQRMVSQFASRGWRMTMNPTIEFSPTLAAFNTKVASLNLPNGTRVAMKFTTPAAENALWTVGYVHNGAIHAQSVTADFPCMAIGAYIEGWVVSRVP